MKILYFDCFAGAAGDMILGALLDAGLPLAELKRALGSLGHEGWDVSAECVVKGGITATKFRVHELAHSHHGHGHQHHFGGTAASSGTHHPHRTLAEIKTLIDRSALSDAGKQRAKSLFDRLAGAEAAVHNMPIERVHLHEVGALDSIIDIVGAVFAIEWFAVERVVASPMNVGSGTVRTAHGVFPVPAPATLRLLGSAPIYGEAVDAELLTPTGALILTDYAAGFGPMPPMRIDRTGYGAGERDLDGRPNVLRVVVGETVQIDDASSRRLTESIPVPGRGAPADAAARVSVIECEIDDLNPQILGELMTRLHEAGALDVFYVPVQMKKNRPGTLVTIVARPDERAALTDLLFRETSTIGVRFIEMQRECLERETICLATPIGEVRLKVARRGETTLNVQPEFDDVARIAAEKGLPMKEVQAIITKAWLDVSR